MTSIKFHFRPSMREGADDGRLFIRVIHRRRSKDIPRGYPIHFSEWDKEYGKIVLPHKDSKRLEYLESISAKMADDTARLESILSKLRERGDYDVEDIMRGFTGNPGNDTIAGYCAKVCLRLEQSAQERTARAYRSAVTSLQSCFEGRKLFLSDINADNMKVYENCLLANNLALNTVSFYMRQLRALYNRAIREKLIIRADDNPFGDVHTGVYKTRRRALTEDELRRLAAVENVLDRRLKPSHKINRQDYHLTLKLKQALQIFLFCFHARGMSFVDMAFLKKSDVGKDTILYCRKKTGRFLEVGITSAMHEIIAVFADEVKDTPYVFPVIDPARSSNPRTQYESGLRSQNQLLGALSTMAGLDKKVTTHVSRHTWASVAKWRQVSVAVISEALGHSDTKVTENYLASFDQSVLDKLSAEISAVVENKRRNVA